MLYICPSNEAIVHSTWGETSHCTWGSDKNVAPTIWGTDWDICGTADYVIIALCPNPCFL